MYIVKVARLSVKSSMKTQSIKLSYIIFYLNKNHLLMSQ